MREMAPGGQGPHHILGRFGERSADDSHPDPTAGKGAAGHPNRATRPGRFAAGAGMRWLAHVLLSLRL
jgi:hypothetical protein